jgi:hypothetical protein
MSDLSVEGDARPMRRQRDEGRKAGGKEGGREGGLTAFVHRA